MVNYTKTRIGAVNGGSITNFDGSTNDVNVTRYDSMSSSHHYGKFSARTIRIQGSRLEGLAWKFNGWDWVSSSYSCPSNFWNFVDEIEVPMPSLIDLATSTLSNSNPNNNDISIPNSLIELRELPGLVKQLGSNALDFVRKNVSRRTFASTNLAIQFGISPMVQDASKLASISKSINNRLLTLQRLRKYGRINKKKRLGLFKHEQTNYVVFVSDGAFVATNVEARAESSVWGISEWVLDPSGSPLMTNQSSLISEFASKVSDCSLTGDRLLAFRMATGTLRYSPSDLWNIIPWSWAVDYFTNVGDLFDATNNVLGLRPVNLAICRTTTTEWSHPEANRGESLTLSPGNAVVVGKSRTPVDITSAQQNTRLFQRFLTPNQIGILSSLAVLKRNPRSPNPYMGWARSIVSRL